MQEKWLIPENLKDMIGDYSLSFLKIFFLLYDKPPALMPDGRPRATLPHECRENTGLEYKLRVGIVYYGKMNHFGDYHDENV